MIQTDKQSRYSRDEKTTSTNVNQRYREEQSSANAKASRNNSDGARKDARVTMFEDTRVHMLGATCSKGYASMFCGQLLRVGYSERMWTRKKVPADRRHEDQHPVGPPDRVPNARHCLFRANRHVPKNGRRMCFTLELGTRTGAMRPKASMNVSPNANTEADA